jgi:hypothetical protein
LLVGIAAVIIGLAVFAIHAPNPTERPTQVGADGTNMRAEWCMAHFAENIPALKSCY